MAATLLSNIKITDVTLSADVRSEELYFGSSDTEYIANLDTDLAKYGADQLLIQVEIEQMKCKILNEDLTPNYIIITEEVQNSYDGKWMEVSRYNPCQAEPVGTKYVFVPSTSRLDGYRIKFRPVGDWSPSTNNGRFRVDLKIIRKGDLLMPYCTVSLLIYLQTCVN